MVAVVPYPPYLPSGMFVSGFGEEGGLFVGGRASWADGRPSCRAGGCVVGDGHSDRRYRVSLGCCRALVTWRVEGCRRGRTAGGS